MKEYQKYYESLLQTRPPENLQEEKIKQDVNIKFQKIVDDEHNVERKPITQLEVKKATLKMKNNKSGDRSRWKAKWLKDDKVQQQYSTELRKKDRYRYNGGRHR